MALKPKIFTLKRQIPDLRVPVSVGCPPGIISVLHDDEGSLISEYQRITTTECGAGAGVFAPDGSPVPLKSRLLFGFDTVVEDHGTIGNFLLAAGFHEDECEQLIERYELRDQAYLPFRLLSPTAQRQMELLALLRQSAEPAGSKLIILNDPFLPFSGRWREAFAELILEHVRTHNATVVVFHLSFRPKAWAEKPEVRDVELIDIDQRAIQRHFAMKIEEERKVTQEIDPNGAKLIESKSSEQAPGNKDGIPDLIDPSLGPLARKTSGWGDFVVKSLGGFSTSVQSMHGAVAFFALAFIVGGIGFAGYPQAAKGWGKVRELSAQYHISWDSFRWGGVQAAAQGDSEGDHVGRDHEQARIPAVVPAEFDGELVEELTPSDASTAHQGSQDEQVVAAVATDISIDPSRETADRDILSEEFGDIPNSEAWQFTFDISTSEGVQGDFLAQPFSLSDGGVTPAPLSAHLDDRFLSAELSDGGALDCDGQSGTLSLAWCGNTEPIDAKPQELSQ